MPSTTDIRSDILAYLTGWYEKAKERQESKGRDFRLTFEEFIDLWGARRLRSLEKWMDDGSLYARQRRHSPDSPNPNGYVLSFTTYAATQTGFMDATNAQICTRAKSEIDCRMKKGDRHTPDAIAKITNKLAGVAKSNAHRANISAAMKGIKRGPMSKQERDKRSATVKATLAAKSAAKTINKETAANAAKGQHEEGNRGSQANS